MDLCRARGCTRQKAAGRKQLCNACYLRRYRSNPAKPCKFCARPAIAKQMCAAHYSRDKRGFDQSKPLVPRYNGQACSVAGCEKPSRKRSLCLFHYSRQRDGVPLDAPPRQSAGKFVNSYGYVTLVHADRSKELEHRAIMAKLIGRPLLRSETVHHKNGNRSDNRLENLELWTKHQPSGQRAEDKVTWAREILALYGHLFPET